MNYHTCIEGATVAMTHVNPRPNDVELTSIYFRSLSIRGICIQPAIAHCNYTLFLSTSDPMLRKCMMVTMVRLHVFCQGNMLQK